MSVLKTWLSVDENRRDVPLDELQLVLQELALKDDVGIRGSNVFTITYSLVVNVSDTTQTRQWICSLSHILHL